MAARHFVIGGSLTDNALLKQNCVTVNDRQINVSQLGITHQTA
jgi:hypothetical protein